MKPKCYKAYIEILQILDKYSVGEGWALHAEHDEIYLASDTLLERISHEDQKRLHFLGCHKNEFGGLSIFT